MRLFLSKRAVIILFFFAVPLIPVAVIWKLAMQAADSWEKWFLEEVEKEDQSW